MELGYWDLKGRAEVSRWLLAYFKVDYKDTMHPLKDANSWFADKKYKLGLEIPNLPYLIHGDFKLTETMAIENYIGELYGGPEFVGATLETRANIQMVYSAITDIFNSTRDPLMKDGNYAQIFEDKFEQYGEIDFKLESLSKMLGTQDYIFGKPSLVDFKLAFTLELCAHLLKPIGMQHHLEKYKNLVDLKDRIRSLAGVKERIEASKGMWYVYQGVIKVDLILDA